MTAISDRPGTAIREVFGPGHALIGVVHCPPFPGSPRHRGEAIGAIYDACVRDAVAYMEGGLSGIVVENHGDVPFSKPEDLGPETAACLAVAADRIRSETGAPFGINVLANAPTHALAVAAATGAAFVRVNQWANAYVANEGFMEGRAAEAMRYRGLLRAEGVRVFADVMVKHGAHAITADRGPQEQARDLAFFDADAIIATGRRTGDAASLDELDALADATHLPLLVGSGVTEKNVAAILSRTQGLIVASSLKRDGVWWNPVEPERVARLVRAARAVWEAPNL